MIEGEKIYIQKFDVWEAYGFINSIQVTLSNGEQSEILKPNDNTHENQQSIAVGLDVAQLKISSGSSSEIYGLKFLNKNNQEISSWGRE